MSGVRYPDFDPETMDLAIDKKLRNGEQKAITFTDGNNIHAWAYLRSGERDSMILLNIILVVCLFTYFILQIIEDNLAWSIIVGLITGMAVITLVSTCIRNFRLTGNMFRTKSQRITVNIPDYMYSHPLIKFSRE